MKKNIVFISWHSDAQEIGKKIADCFRKHFGNIFGKEISVFESHVDIKHGWTKELSTALDNSKYGIILLTPQALDSAWMYYEFGVLRRTPEHVWCFPFGKVNRDKTPFAINQYLEFSEDELSKMLETIVKKELADDFIGWDEGSTIRNKIKEYVPQLFSDVNKIASNIDNNYERNFTIREKYFQMIKNVNDVSVNQRIIELEAEVAKYKKQLILKGNPESEKDKTISQKVAEIATLNARIVDLEAKLDKQSTKNTSSSSKFCNVIDLGYGTLWADRNINASSPGDYGYYFAWGETEPKPEGEYNWDTYKYGQKPIILPPDHDAATANWGSDWCMPTKEEFEELIKNCEKPEWTKVDGNFGMLFTSKKNGNTIFFPAAGLMWPSLDGGGERGHYWSSSVYGAYGAWRLGFRSDDAGVYSHYSRKNGLSVRAVRCKN